LGAKVAAGAEAGADAGTGAGTYLYSVTVTGRRAMSEVNIHEIKNTGVEEQCKDKEDTLPKTVFWRLAKLTAGRESP
jgi:hypothetical protein